MSDSDQVFIEMSAKWNGADYKVSNLLVTHTVLHFKRELHTQTRVLPERQKLLGLKSKSGQVVTDSTLINDLSYKPGVTKIMLMGRLTQ